MSWTGVKDVVLQCHGKLYHHLLLVCHQRERAEVLFAAEGGGESGEKSPATRQGEERVRRGARGRKPGH